MTIRAPSCCDANRAHGFIRAVPSPSGRDEWEITVISARGEVIRCRSFRCPVCGAHARGLDLVDVPETTGLETHELPCPRSMLD